MGMEESVEISIPYDFYFKREIKDASVYTDPPQKISITVGDRQVMGEGTHVDATLHYFFRDLLDGTGAILEGEKFVHKFEGPVFLVIEPRSEDSVSISRCFREASVENPDERLDFEPSFSVEKRPFVEEVIESAEEHREQVLEVNDALEDDSSMTELLERLREAKRLYRDAYGPLPDE